MAPSPSRIAAQEGDTYVDSTMIKMQRLIYAMSLSMTETTIEEFHDTLCKKSLQDIAWIHAQFDYPNPFPISSEEPTESLINPCVEYGSLIHEMQSLQGQMGLLNFVVTLPNLPATEIDNLPTLTRINLFRGEVDLPLIENIPAALRLARPVELTLRDVTPVRISELKDVIGWHKRAHLYLEAEAARCKGILLNRQQVLLEKPDHGVVSHPPSSINDSQVHEDNYDRPATQSLLEENEKPSKSVATINQRKRKNRKRKNKVVVNGTLLQDSPGSAEGGVSVNEPFKDLISPNILPVPTTSAESGRSSHPPPIRRRPINSRERDLLDSLYEMLVECANRTDSRAFRTVKPKAPTLCSDGETIVGQEIAQKRKNSHHSKEARKRRQAIQRRRKRESRLSITISSLSPHILSPELPLPRPSFKRSKHRIEEGERSLSAPPVLLHPQPETSTYSGSPFINPWDRPASASGNLPHTQTIRAVSF
ncbi:hypothetical protein N7449_001344 [Penicillium cf. viridicatum]|uniref:Uncharacterized protein n=1 Tax=Penicillium cf. viridicatum TaxID=2972119 RepID=A0A9W9TA64_9EURO|nr:hypothetical protein N7449_001344 [Penicillium cf. viridicatum]